MGSIGARRSRTRRPPPAPPTRRSAAAAIQPVRRLIWIALDPHHRKNNHAGRLGTGVDIAAATDGAMPVWKLHDDSHAPSPRTPGLSLLLRPPIGPSCD